jgi:D-3-phosphoglycerate dehydrogenase
MRIVVADEMELEPFQDLPLLGVEVVYRPELEAATLPGALDEAQVLVVRSTPVTAAAIERSRQLSLIISAGVEVNMIDLEAASDRGIYVANCRGKNAAAVAELAFALILALDRQLVDATLDLRAGRWNQPRYLGAPGIEGRRIGIAGLGAVGQRMLSCARAFGMAPHAWSRSLTPAQAARMGVGYCSSLEELASHSDVLTVHLPLRADTRHRIGREVLEALPDGAMLVHTAHPEILDYAALREIAPRKRLRVGLDVYGEEPRVPVADFVEPAFRNALVYGTPHVAGSTRRAELAVAREVCRIVRAFATEGEVPNALNSCRNTPARFIIALRMLDRVGVLANALNVIKRHGINVEEITNTVFDGARAACTKLRVSGRPTEACVQEISAFDEVLHVEVFQLPNLA